MIKYAIKRILIVIPIILAVILVLFILLYFISGSSISRMTSYGGGDTLDSIFGFFKLTDNFFTKYIRYCYNVFFHFDFGRSSSTMMRLMGELDYRIRNTVSLLAVGVGATLIIGIPIGAFAAVRKNHMRDRVISVIVMFFSAIPNYALAIAITLFFAVYLRVVPVIITYTSPIAYFLPMLTLSLGGIASIARMTRASMIEELQRPYITALRSKGLKDGSVVYRHALKNALVPVISALGGLIAQLLCGTFVVEHFFNVPGLGSYMLRSVGSRSHLEILGCTVLMTFILAITNIAADVLYSFVNPQIKLRYTKSSKKIIHDKTPYHSIGRVGKEAAQ